MCDFWQFSKSFDTCGLASSVVKLFLPCAMQGSVSAVLAGSTLNPDEHLHVLPSHSLLAPVHVSTHTENNGRNCFNPNWHEGGHFPPPILFGSECVSWFFLSNISKINWRWKLTSIGLFWHSAKLIESYKKMTQGGAKDEHFSCFHSSRQLGLIRFQSQLCWILQTTDPWVSKDSESCGKSNNTHL